MKQYVDFAALEKDFHTKLVFTTEYNRSNKEVPYVSPSLLGRLGEVASIRKRPGAYMYEAKRHG